VLAMKNELLDELFAIGIGKLVGLIGTAARIAW
jgi:hypothetical protein